MGRRVRRRSWSEGRFSTEVKIRSPRGGPPQQKGGSHVIVRAAAFHSRYFRTNPTLARAAAACGRTRAPIIGRARGAARADCVGVV